MLDFPYAWVQKVRFAAPMDELNRQKEDERVAKAEVKEKQKKDRESRAEDACQSINVVKDKCSQSK